LYFLPAMTFLLTIFGLLLNLSSTILILTKGAAFNSGRRR
jgi:flagellar biosynthesis component FlhA